MPSYCCFSVQRFGSFVRSFVHCSGVGPTNATIMFYMGIFFIAFELVLMPFHVDYLTHSVSLHYTHMYAIVYMEGCVDNIKKEIINKKKMINK